MFIKFQYNKHKNILLAISLNYAIRKDKKYQYLVNLLIKDWDN